MDHKSANQAILCDSDQLHAWERKNVHLSHTIHTCMCEHRTTTVRVLFDLINSHAGMETASIPAASMGVSRVPPDSNYRQVALFLKQRQLFQFQICFLH